jgi:hypothetical protein
MVFGRDSTFSAVIGQADPPPGTLSRSASVAVGAHDGGKHPAGCVGFGFVGFAEHHGSSTVAEEHAGVAVLPVDEAAELFRTDDEGGGAVAGVDEMAGDLQGIQEAGAGGGNVETDRIQGTELLLHKAGRGGEEHVRRDGGDDDELDLLRSDPCGVHGAACRLGGQITGGLIGGCDTAFLDAGARGDPLVGGIDDLGKVVVGQHFFGHVAAGANDAGGAKGRGTRSGHGGKWNGRWRRLRCEDPPGV